MSKEGEKFKPFADAVTAYLQPILDKHFTLETWAGIWAEETLGFGGNVFEKLQRVLPACSNIYGSVLGFSGESPWDAVCGLSMVISLKGYDLPLMAIIDRGTVVCVEPDEYDFPEEARELDLAREFEKKLTLIALSA